MKKIVVAGILLLSLNPVFSQKRLTLEQCRQMALEHNKSLQMANESVKAATELKKAAFTQFLPNFSATGAYTWNQKGISLMSEDGHLPVGTLDTNGNFTFRPDQLNNSWLTDASGKPVAPLDASGKPFDPKVNPEKLMIKNYALLPKEALELDMKNIFVGTIGFIQPIYMGGKIRELNKIAQSAENIAKAQQDNKTSELLEEVDEAYWRVVSVENKVLLARQYRQLIARLDSNVAIMIEEGVSTKAEALKIKVKLNEADVSLTKAENGLALSRMALCQLCGMELELEFNLDDSLLDNESKIQTLIPMDQALANRPEMKALVQMEKIAASNERIMFSRFLPNVGLAGNYIISNPNSFNGFEKKFAGMFNFGVVANVPLFHFGERVRTLNAAKAERRIAEMRIEEVKEKMELQIKQSNYKLSESRKKRIATESNIKHAEENLRYATEGFDAGVISSTDLLAAQTAWVSAKSESIDAAIDEKLCNTYLAKALGVLK